VIKRGKPARDGQVRLTFTVPVDQAPGGLSLVGDFNDWDPYAHPMQPKNFVYEVSVTVPADRPICFRYLAHGGVWFDDADADFHDQHGGHIEPVRIAPAPEVRAEAAPVTDVLA
jgi:1,4-alpha-glucan branching enzyme